MSLALTLLATGGIAPAVAQTKQPAAASSPLGARALTYRISRGQLELGRQSVTFREADGVLEVDTAVSVQVNAGGRQVYQFSQEIHEEWRDRRLVAFHAQANDNGVRHSVELASGAGSSALVTDGRRHDVTSEIAPSTLWHPFMLRRPLMFDTLHGDIRAIDLRDEGEVTIRWGGRDTVTRLYLLKGQIKRKLWYDKGNQLIRLALTARDGSEVVFELLR